MKKLELYSRLSEVLLLLEEGKVGYAKEILDIILIELKYDMHG